MMSYRIERRDLDWVVIHEGTGDECGRYALRTAAVARIEELGRIPSRRPWSLKARFDEAEQLRDRMSRSSKYRLSNGNKALQFLLMPKSWQRLDQRWRKSLKATSDWFDAKPIDVTASDWMAHRCDALYARAFHAKKATTVKRRLADERLKKALVLLAQGIKKKDVAAAVGMTDRGLRKALMREK